MSSGYLSINTCTYERDVRTQPQAATRATVNSRLNSSPVQLQDQSSEDRRSMERKTRAVVAAWCLMMVLLSGQQQQAAAMTKYWRCYKKCYAECRKDIGPYPCNFECLQDSKSKSKSKSKSDTADCGDICNIKIRVCGVMETAMATAACVADCTNKLGGAFAPSASKIIN